MTRHLTCEWAYKDKDGNLVGIVKRYDSAKGKEVIPFFKRSGSGEFKAGIPPELNRQRPLFGLEAVKDATEAVYIVEGEKCASALISLGYQAVTWLGGTQAVDLAAWEALGSIKEAVILPDNDAAGEAVIQPLQKRLKALNPKIELTIIRFPELPEGGDICDYLLKHDSLSDWNGFNSLISHPYKQTIRHALTIDFKALRQTLPLTGELSGSLTASGLRHGLKVLSFGELNTATLPERKPLLEPWLLERSVNMVFAERGLGKTYFCISCAVALSEGRDTLAYKAARPVRVLYLDGEMPAALLRQRIRGFISNQALVEQNLFIYTPDCQTAPIPNMGEQVDLEAINQLISEIEPDVIFVDNISTFIRSGKENEGESWLPVQEWAIFQRSSGRSLVFIHHTNKEGSQRGSSRREDIMDVVLHLKRPEDFSGQSEGAHFEIHYTKNRHLFGEAIRPIDAKLKNLDGRLEWACAKPTGNFEKAVDMLRNGKKQSEICSALDLPKSTVSRWKSAAQADGLLKVPEFHG